LRDSKVEKTRNSKPSILHVKLQEFTADMAMNDLETIFDCRGVIPTVKFISKTLLNKAASCVIKIQKSTYSF
jgi:hypothetical protein